jgi:4-hydroxy-2-oxoheptanedioate aldolase
MEDAMRRCSSFLVALAGVALLMTSVPAAQQAPAHLNPVIAKLAKGEAFVGVNTGDLSLENARTLARAPIDYVYVDMEHTPLDIAGLHMFNIGMIDKAAAVKKASVAPNVALFARFPPEADEGAWVVKQALDIGLMGVIFNGVDTREQALAAVKSMRYPQMKGSKYFEPAGIRGAAPALATWIWGLSTEDYERHADLWPLNPEGDLLAIAMIESTEGMQNLDAILSTPGIGAAFIGNANDLRHSMGVAANAPEVETARQTILAGCKRHNVACGITVNSGADMVKRLNEGWKMIRATVEIIRDGRALQERR